MLKKSGALVLTMLYLVTVVGFALNLHYCGQTITAVKIDAPVKGCASDLMMAAKMKCCHDKQIDVQIKDAHQGEFPSFIGKQFSFHIAKLPYANVAFYAQAVTIQHFADRAPPNPLLTGTPTFIKNCTFRI